MFLCGKADSSALVAAGIGAIDQHKRKEFCMKNIYLILIWLLHKSFDSKKKLIKHANKFIINVFTKVNWL